MPPIFQEREAVENLTKGLAELQLLAKAKEQKNLPSGRMETEQRTVAAPRGRGSSWNDPRRGGSWNGPPRRDFRSRPMEGQRGRPTWRSRPYIPIEQRVCYECGKLGHISYNCPKLQAQGKLASIARSNPTSCKEAENPSSDECDEESFSEEDYEKNEYEIQAFMAGGRERQERADARAARKREEEAVPVQPPAPVRPSAERAAPPRQVKRKPVLEAQWQKYDRENWTIPIGMLAGKSRREVYGQAMLALRDALGRQT